MAETPLDPALAQARLARRLVRLFRIERTGRFDAARGETVRRLVERRGGLIEMLMRLEGQRRREAAPLPADLEDGLRDLAAEVARCRGPIEIRLMRLADDLDLRRGAGMASGVRDRDAATLLGTG